MSRTKEIIDIWGNSGTLFGVAKLGYVRWSNGRKNSDIWETEVGLVLLNSEMSHGRTEGIMVTVGNGILSFLLPPFYCVGPSQAVKVAVEI